MMKRYSFSICTFIFFLCSMQAFAQSGQLSVSKVSSMPNMPSPYIMRNWKDVAIKYDSFIYDLNKTGQYLPLMHLKASGINYPSLQPILLDSYVGSPGGGSAGGAIAEAVNVIPSVVSASLVGVDKSAQFNNNWVLKIKDFFNKANGQNVYLNGYSAGSGSDWWYDLMPNIFFYQLYSQYPNTTDFDQQFVTIADRELGVVQALGGSTTPWAVPNLNYRGFNLATNKPNTTGVTEPEAAGTIAWILYHAYVKTGDKKYLDGAQLAITFLSNFTANPAYEIQLPYGSFIAARMNAELGTKYNLQKMVNWSFDQSSKRNWGTIVGTWGDGTTGPTDVSGLVGEVDNPNTGYAFAMNGFQQAAALVPMIKYDKRFAHDIAKWTLNLANASRLFYSKYLPPSHQDDYTWASTYDPNSVIAYESLKQNDGGVLLKATGDAERGGWAALNLGVYGSSHVGYLGAIVQTTDVDGILLLDANKTDFFGANPFPTHVIYNPYATVKQVTIPVGGTAIDIYDAVSETTIKTNVSGAVVIDMPANTARLLVYLPSGTTTTAVNGKLMAGTKIVDYHYGYNFSGMLHIRSVATKDTLAQFGQVVKVYSSVENRAGATTFNWSVKGTQLASSADSTFNWTIPSVAGKTYLVLNVTSGSQTAKDSLLVNVVATLPKPPIVKNITSDSLFYYAGSTGTFICNLGVGETGKHTYEWTVPTGGDIIQQKDSLLRWKTIPGEGLFTISCKVTNASTLSTTVSKAVLVKIKSSGVTGPVAYFPLDGDTKDYSGNGHNATSAGITLTADARGEANHAFFFDDGADIIDVPNASTLNFQNQITLSCWVNLSTVFEESFVLSHGSYEERWKISVTNTLNNMRWTIKTSTATYDLDSSFPLAYNKYYHFTVVYTGYSMEMYVNGVLDGYVAATGALATSSKDITFGRKDAGNQQYHLNGALDEVRIYDKALSPNEIFTLKSLWSTATVTGVEELTANVEVYPNPSHGSFSVIGINDGDAQLRLIDVMGRPVSFTSTRSGAATIVEYASSASGILLLKVQTKSGVAWKKLIVN